MLFSLLCLFFIGTKAFAKEGALEFKTDSVTQKKQWSKGNEIEHI